MTRVPIDDDTLEEILNQQEQAGPPDPAGDQEKIEERARKRAKEAFEKLTEGDDS